MSATTDATDTAAPLAGHHRRGPLGRLYHGETAIDFYGRRYIGIGLSALLIVVSVVSLFFQGLNLGIDFKGGVAWEVPAANVTIDQARQILSDNQIDGSDAKIQTLTSDSGTRLRIQVGDQPPETVQAVQQAYADAAGVDIAQVASTSVSASWGKSITQKAIRALVVFILLVAAVMSWRFEWRMALSAILAMVHDVLISVGVYSVLELEVTPATVVAFLTILGFSLYDTIVVFDKIKENVARYVTSKVSYGDVVNVSMNQVLMRSINTNIAAVLPVLSLLVLGSWVMGAVALQEFALALLIGLLTGSYSSIFIAAPLLGMLKDREPRYRAHRHQISTGTDLERLVLGALPATRREGARLRAPAEAASSEVITTVTPDRALTHPPRPRKKRRR